MIWTRVPLGSYRSIKVLASGPSEIRDGPFDVRELIAAVPDLLEAEHNGVKAAGGVQVGNRDADVRHAVGDTVRAEVFFLLANGPLR
jgi:hypothetical protein